MEVEKLVRLSRARDEQDVEYLLDALRDPKNRYMAARYLGELRAHEAVKPLIGLLRAGEPATRSSAADALASIGAREALPDLAERVQEEEDFVVRTWLIKALARLGDARAIAPLTDLLRDESVRIRHYAAAALEVLGNADALDALNEAMSKERWVNRGPYRRAIRKIQRHARSNPGRLDDFEE